jgi:hypothetical protein
MQLTAIQYFISAAAVVVLAMAKVVTAEGLQMAKVKQVGNRCSFGLVRL